MEASADYDELINLLEESEKKNLRLKFIIKFQKIFLKQHLILIIQLGEQKKYN